MHENSRGVDIKALISHIVKGDGMERCRICMGDTSQGQVHLGDTFMMDGDRAVTLAELLEILTGVQVPVDDIQPPGICCSCANSAAAAIAFKALCKHSASQWNTTVELLNELPTDSDNAIYFCIDIDKKTTKCEKEFLFDNPKLNDNLIESKRTSGTKKIACLHCGKKFLHPKQLFYHLIDSRDMKRACYVCGEVKLHDELISHLRKVHSLEAILCKECSGICLTQNDLLCHKEKYHKSGQFMCGECGRSFNSQRVLHAHGWVHSQVNCVGCKKVFLNHACYLYHSKISLKCKESISLKKMKHKLPKGISAPQECICNECGKKFRNKKLIISHLKIVHLRSTHRPCPYCGRYLASAHMTDHIKHHENPQEYPCDQCNVVLKSRVGHRQHMRLHTGEKPFQCPHCSATFLGSSRRSHHIRKVHMHIENVRKHICDSCNAKFYSIQNLKNHLQRCHGEKNTECGFIFCKVCNEAFLSVRSLSCHMKSHDYYSDNTCGKSPDTDINIVPLVCKDCKETFTSKQLEEHTMLHKSQAKDMEKKKVCYSCGECNRTFFDVESFIRHCKIHNEVACVVVEITLKDRLFIVDVENINEIVITKEKNNATLKNEDPVFVQSKSNVEQKQNMNISERFSIPKYYAVKKIAK